MNNDRNAWISSLTASGAQFANDGENVVSFGDAADELELSSQGALVLCPLHHLQVLSCQGDDRLSFLHSQLTNDVKHLGQGQVQHAAWCSAKGRMLANFLVWSAQDEQAPSVNLLLAADLAPAIAKRLAMFVLRAKVSITPRHDYVVLGVAGGNVGMALQSLGLNLPNGVLHSANTDNATLLQLENGRFLLYIPVAEASAWWDKLATLAKPVGKPAWDYLEIEAGIPLITAATREEFVPQMADFEKIGGVSFHKGCYPGQEIVARTQYLGKVKRHLYRVQSSANLQPGDDLFSPEHPEQAVGKLVTTAPHPDGACYGLAVVQANYANSLHHLQLDGVSVSATAVNPEVVA